MPFLVHTETFGTSVGHSDQPTFNGEKVIYRKYSFL